MILTKLSHNNVYSVAQKKVAKFLANHFSFITCIQKSHISFEIAIGIYCVASAVCITSIKFKRLTIIESNKVVFILIYLV